jgi:SAM-dependent methyltransferase
VARGARIAAFANNLGVRLRAARRLGIARSLVRLCRLAGVVDTRWLRRWDLLHDERIRRPQRMREFLERYQAQAAAAGCPPVSFAGRRVLEIGCGPLGGWAPLAVFHGAAAYVGADPGIDPQLLHGDAFARAYLRPVFDDLSLGGGQAADFQAFLAAYAARAAFIAGPIEALAEADRFDLVLSNSCLEHIGDFDSFARALVHRLAPGARMLHLVDFSNHRDKEAPFARIYEQPPAAYHRRYGAHINLLRAPDVARALSRHGLPTRWIPVDRRPEALTAVAVDRWWSERYDEATLALRTALLVEAGET